MLVLRRERKKGEPISLWATERGTRERGERGGFHLCELAGRRRSFFHTQPFSVPGDGGGVSSRRRAFNISETDTPSRGEKKAAFSTHVTQYAPEIKKRHNKNGMLRPLSRVNREERRRGPCHTLSPCRQGENSPLGKFGLLPRRFSPRGSLRSLSVQKLRVPRACEKSYGLSTERKKRREGGVLLRCVREGRGG